MNIKRKLCLLLVLSLGITPILTSINKSTSFAKESKTTIDENIAKKLGVDPSDVEFSNIDIDALLTEFFQMTNICLMIILVYHLNL